MCITCQRVSHHSASWNQYHNMPLVKHVAKLKTSAHHAHHHWPFNTSIIHISDSADIVQYWTEEDGDTFCDCFLNWVLGTVAISNHCWTPIAGIFIAFSVAATTVFALDLFGRDWRSQYLDSYLDLRRRPWFATVAMILWRGSNVAAYADRVCWTREQFACTWGWYCYWRWWWSKDATEEEAKWLPVFPYVCHGRHHEVPPQHVWARWHGSFPHISHGTETQCGLHQICHHWEWTLTASLIHWWQGYRQTSEHHPEAWTIMLMQSQNKQHSRCYHDLQGRLEQCGGVGLVSAPTLCTSMKSKPSNLALYAHCYTFWSM